MPPRKNTSKISACERLRKLTGRRGLPKDLTPFYTFVGDQDLLHHNPVRPRITQREYRKAVGAARMLPPVAKAALLGCADIFAGKTAAAQRRLGVALKRFPNDGDVALLAALAHWLRCDETRSRRWLWFALGAADAAVLQRRSRETLLLRAQIRFEFEDNIAGLKDLDAILRRHPDDLDTRVGRIDILTDLFRYRPALAEANRVLAMRPGAWWLYAQRGKLKGFCGRLRGSLADFSEALRRQPRNGAVYSWRAEVLRRLGRYAEAEADCEKAMRFAPEYPYSWEIAGRIRLLVGDDAAAWRFLNRTCRLDPAHKMAFAWRGEAAWKLGRLRAAWRDFDFVAPLGQRPSWNISTEEGHVPTRAQRDSGFWKNADTVVERWPRDPFAWALRGRGLVQNGRPREALADLARAHQLAKNAIDRRHILAWRGRAALEAGAMGRALKDLAQAASAAPAYGMWLAQAHEMRGEGSAALQLLERVLILEQRLAPGYMLRARLLEKKGELSRALSDYQMAFVLDTKLGEAQTAARRLAAA
jgi:tetratricopeptide (TPR) repeat protein